MKAGLARLRRLQESNDEIAEALKDLSTTMASQRSAVVGHQ